jgi:hypothetical protein
MVLLVLVWRSVCGAAETEPSWIDYWHDVLSDQIRSASVAIDRTLAGTLVDENTTDVNQSDVPYDADAFALSEKYLEGTDTAYVRLRMQYAQHTRDKDKAAADLGASLPLQASNRRLHLFVEGLRSEEEDPFAQGQAMSDTQNADTEYGLKYIAIIGDAIESKYQVGVRGPTAFIRWRYSYRFDTKFWRIEPVQTFEYSNADKFEETTDLYIDRYLAPWMMLRFAADRGTSELSKGYAYGGRAELFFRVTPRVSLRVVHAVSGHTHYEYEDPDTGEDERYSGIINRATDVIWRQNVWKPWFFVQVAAGANRHRRYDYQSDIHLIGTLDFYFGHIP